MKIELKEILIKDVVNQYKNNYEEGVVGYSGELNIRPKYQREFVYNIVQQKEVINTILNNYPLNVMYWIKTQKGFELLDGQQRTLSICEYIVGNFSINENYFHSLTDEEQNKILNYKLMIYICEGSEREQLDWFKTINIAGVKLTDQELRNAVYTGEWLSDAKRYFSKTNCGAYNIAKGYIKGTPIRQDYLETALKWISVKNNISIEEYMSKNQHNKDAQELWKYFNDVVNWFEKLFPKYRKEMNGLSLGLLYNIYNNTKYNYKEFDNLISLLMQDEDVTRKQGIFEYLITNEEKYLNIRAFTSNQKIEAYEKQNGLCFSCSNTFEPDEMEADHIKAWHVGGKTSSNNCQMLCKKCNRTKSGK